MNTLHHYMTLRYPIEILPDEDGFVALLPDLPGCMSSGRTIDEAVSGLNEAKELWLEGKLEHGEFIPQPTEIDEFSGKFVLRIPKSLHRSLDREARRQGVSLNQYLVHVLSERHVLAGLREKCQEIFTAVACNLADSYSFAKPAHLDQGWWSGEYSRRWGSTPNTDADLNMIAYVPGPPKVQHFFPSRSCKPDDFEFAVQVRSGAREVK